MPVTGKKKTARRLGTREETRERLSLAALKLLHEGARRPSPPSA